MITRGNIDTIIAIHDQFLDTTSHFWHWQLSPDPAETNITLGYENNLSTFILHGRNGSWLKGWLYNDQDATYNNTKDVLRIIKSGVNANFKIVMALGMGSIPVANRTTSGLNIADICIDFDTLDQGLQVIVTAADNRTNKNIHIISISARSRTVSRYSSALLTMIKLCSPPHCTFLLVLNNNDNNRNS
jgi:hypothetical protein